MSSRAAALERLAHWPRTSLVREPTPLITAPNLSAELGLDHPILMKMDGETGFALGGNKTRKLEFELAPDRVKGVTHLVTCGGVHSNHCRLTAAAAARLGLECTLVLNGEAPDDPTGNALLHRLFGADIRMVEANTDRDPEMARAAEEIEAAGGRALVVPLGASTSLGCLGYARAAVEFDRQHPASEGTITWVFVSASSCGTYAGLVLGFGLLERDDVRVVGVSPDTSEDEIREITRYLVHGASELLSLDEPIPTDDLLCTEAFVGDGYGIATPESEAAARLLARLEGVLVEQAYTAKVAAALIDQVRAGTIDRHDRVVFWHTGGYPTVFR